MKALPGQNHCFAHSEALRERRRAGNALGGQNKATGRRAERLMPNALRRDFDRLAGIMDAVEAGSLHPRVGSALASLALARLKIWEGALLEARVEALERLMGRDARAG